MHADGKAAKIDAELIMQDFEDEDFALPGSLRATAGGRPRTQQRQAAQTKQPQETQQAAPVQQHLTTTTQMESLRPTTGMKQTPSTLLLTQASTLRPPTGIKQATTQRGSQAPPPPPIRQLPASITQRAPHHQTTQQRSQSPQPQQRSPHGQYSTLSAAGAVMAQAQQRSPQHAPKLSSPKQAAHLSPEQQLQLQQLQQLKWQQELEATPAQPLGASQTFMRPCTQQRQFQRLQQQQQRQRQQRGISLQVRPREGMEGASPTRAARKHASMSPSAVRR